MILSVDPGKRACGCALWAQTTFGAELHRAEIVQGAPPGIVRDPEVWKWTAHAVWRWVRVRADPAITQVAFERMPAYRSDTPSRTMAVQDLVAVAAWICALFPQAEHHAYFPREWEGNLNRKGPSDPVVERVKGRLTPEEFSRVVLPGASSKAHNVWDSVGIGLYHLGRFAPKKVFARL